MANNVSIYIQSNDNEINMSTSNPLKKSSSNTNSQPSNWYYGMTTTTNEDIFIVINVSGWYNFLLSGPGGPAGPNGDGGLGGGGGAGCAISQLIYLGAGTIICAVLLPSANPSVLMLLQNNTYSCYANGLYYVIGITSSPDPNYEYEYSNTSFTYNGSTIPQGKYPANTAVAGSAGSNGGDNYGGNGGNGGNGASGGSGGQVTPTYTWYGASYPNMSNPFYEICSYVPTGVGGGGGNGGTYSPNPNYYGKPGVSYTPATAASTGGSNPPGYVNFTCADGLTVVINKGGYQNEAADSPFFMVYYYAT